MSQTNGDHMHFLDSELLFIFFLTAITCSVVMFHFGSI